MNLTDIHRRSTRFLRVLYQQKYCQLGIKRAERGENERKHLDLHNSVGNNKPNKITHLKNCATFHVKGRMIQSAEPQRIILRPSNKKPSWLLKQLGINDSFFFFSYMFSLFEQECV